MKATDVTGDLLKAVSRSFYLTIRFLPQEMRPAVALGYMLARATDTVADNASASPELRIHVLQRMADAISGNMNEAEIQDVSRVLNLEVEHESEAILLQEFPRCLLALETFDETQKALIRKVLATIIQGQLWDLTAFAQRDTVESDEETKRYTYSVAGCVGEFWTELGYATMNARFCNPERSEVMVQAGIRYGQGLQLINILRDMQEDEARGRHYLCSDAHKWLNRAASYMNDGIDYCLRLGTFRLRFASILPALLGKKTIELLRVSTLGTGKVKIKRRVVYGCLLKAIFLCLRRKQSMGI